MIDGLSQLIADIEAHPPNANGTFAGVLGYLRELQRMRAAVPKRTLIDRSTCCDEWKQGWNACIDAFERAMKGET